MHVKYSNIHHSMYTAGKAAYNINLVYNELLHNVLTVQENNFFAEYILIYGISLSNFKRPFSLKNMENGLRQNWQFNSEGWVRAML